VKYAKEVHLDLALMPLPHAKLSSSYRNYVHL
jgi:hypothetical protein